MKTPPPPPTTTSTPPQLVECVYLLRARCCKWMRTSDLQDLLIISACNYQSGLAGHGWHHVFLLLLLLLILNTFSTLCTIYSPGHDVLMWSGQSDRCTLWSALGWLIKLWVLFSLTCWSGLQSPPPPPPSFLFCSSSSRCCLLCLGCQLFGHQRPVRCHLQDGGQHDQRQNPRGDQEDFQHKKWFHRGGGSPGSYSIYRSILLASVVRGAV